MIVSSEKW